MFPGSYLIGLTDIDEEGRWRWDVDGTVMTCEMWDTLWRGDEPNGGNRNEDCVASANTGPNASTTIKFLDIPCSRWAPLKFICEKYPL
ncbi:hepatic lectin-like [Aplysia californica]|uniref:Hepatic lectin-like n=1 Tax=Aplysia californica TaxID=6500 RepID=A0ABM0ZWG3_APLCA|nr:hepatic lectin-like [Aplysia californica]